jgi:hypothetical protein
MLAGKQIVKFARISTRLVSSCRASLMNRIGCGAVMLGYFDMAPWLSRLENRDVGAAVREIDPLSTDAIVRRWQIFTGKDAVCASTAATFTEREAAVNARNNDPAGGGALL